MGKTVRWVLIGVVALNNSYQFANYLENYYKLVKSVNSINDQLNNSYQIATIAETIG